MWNICVEYSCRIFAFPNKNIYFNSYCCKNSIVVVNIVYFFLVILIIKSTLAQDIKRCGQLVSILHLYLIMMSNGELVLELSRFLKK